MYMRPIFTDGVAWSVCLLVGHPLIGGGQEGEGKERVGNRERRERVNYWYVHCSVLIYFTYNDHRCRPDNNQAYSKYIQALAGILRSPLCYHAPIANPPDSAQLGGTSYHSTNLHQVRAVVRECGEGQTYKRSYGAAVCLQV